MTNKCYSIWHLPGGYLLYLDTIISRIKANYVLLNLECCRVKARYRIIESYSINISSKQVDILFKTKSQSMFHII